MNCSYRILKNVHIGQRVRKTSDKNTVPFNNEPMTDMKIERWDKLGFYLSHPNLPEVKYHDGKKEIWLDFDQLPLNQLNIEMGIIKNPLTFVEQIVGGGTTSMVLIRADTFDYLELLDDKKAKDEAIKYKPSELKPGDQVISCLCREGNVMVFLGKFVPVYKKEPYHYSRSYTPSERRGYIESTPERYFFAYPQPNGKYKIEDYPLTNKTVVELYKASDKGKAFNENRFDDLETNRQIILYSIFSKMEDGKASNYHIGVNDESLLTNFDFICKNGTNYSTMYVGSSKKNICENAIEFHNNFLKQDKIIFKTEKEYYDWYSAKRY